ncbi:MAG: hypothetical protein P4N59_00045, partial [Negativicutes bacterium]|nr:hypothetical protein [Negativicutes bacterium]
SGQDLTLQTNTVIVGQQMNLRCQPTSTNFPATNFQWTVPGYTLTNWYTSGGYWIDAILYPTNGYALPLTATNTQGINFFWTDGETNIANASNLVVTCSATVAGAPVTAQATFNVLKPMVEISAQTSAINLGYSVGSQGTDYSLCFGTNPTPGILFKPTYAMPPGTNYNHGNTQIGFEWVQILNYYREAAYYVSGTPPGILEITNEFVLDGPASYGFSKVFLWPNTDDSPSVPAMTGVLSGVSLTLNATMWLMFSPGNGQFVPIRQVPWYCSGSATNLGTGWTVTSQNWSTNPPDFDAGKSYPFYTNGLISWGITAK